MLGVFKGRDRTVVAPTCYLSGIFFFAILFLFLPFVSPFGGRLSHARRFVMSRLRRHDGAAGAPMGANVGEYLLLARPLFCVYFRGGATCGWFGCAKTTGVLIEPGFHLALGFWHLRGINGSP